MSDDPTDIPSLEARVEAMRRLGVLEWGAIKLGPMPPTEAKTETQQKKSADELEQERRKARRDIALGASGSLVPRLGERPE